MIVFGNDATIESLARGSWLMQYAFIAGIVAPIAYLQISDCVRRKLERSKI
jgi:hypothetical protein